MKLNRRQTISSLGRGAPHWGPLPSLAPLAVSEKLFGGGGAVAMTVSLDDRLAGESAPKTYFMWEVEPGQHVLKSHAENVSILLLTTEAGKNYYVWQEVKLGALYARSRLQQVDEATGRQGVLECKRAQSAF